MTTTSQYGSYGSFFTISNRIQNPAVTMGYKINPNSTIGYILKYALIQCTQTQLNPLDSP